MAFGSGGRRSIQLSYGRNHDLTHTTDKRRARRASRARRGALGPRKGKRGLGAKPRLENGAPGGTRTPDLRVRSPALYPAELQARSIRGLEPLDLTMRLLRPRVFLDT